MGELSEMSSSSVIIFFTGVTGLCERVTLVVFRPQRDHHLIEVRQFVCFSDT